MPKLSDALPAIRTLNSEQSWGFLLWQTLGQGIYTTSCLGLELPSTWFP